MKYFYRLVTINHQQVYMTLITLRRSLVQRSRSQSNGYRSLVHVIMR